MHVRRALALSVLAPLLLAGCSDGDSQSTPTPKMPESTSSSPSPSESETPEAESAEDFVRRWVEVNTAMQNSGDAAEYRELSTKCKPCNQTADQIEGFYANGGWVKTKGWIIRKVVDRTGSGGAPVYDLQIDSSPTRYRESAGAEVQSLSGGPIVMRVRLNASAPWNVVQLTQVAS